MYNYCGACTKKALAKLCDEIDAAIIANETLDPDGVLKTMTTTAKVYLATPGVTVTNVRPYVSDLLRVSRHKQLESSGI